MTAGRGIIHQELADGDEQVHSLQLWLNLPAAHKMRAPRWQNLLAGEVDIGDARVVDGQVAISHPGSGDAVGVTAHSDARLLLFSGLPIREPVVQRGPFVMNTADEIDQAIREYRSGRLAPWPT